MFNFERNFSSSTPTYPLNICLPCLLEAMRTFYVVIFFITHYFRNLQKISTKSQPGDASSHDDYKRITRIGV